MIQNHRFGTGLNKYLKYIPFTDNSLTSDNFFRVLDAPDRFYVGKTSFRIRANLDTLAYGSTIYIDIIDSTGNTIYHEVVDFIGKDKSRLIVAHVYSNTPPGEATIYIAGRTIIHPSAGHALDYNNNPDSWDNIHIPNIVWKKKVVIIPSDQNNDEVLFLKAPEVSCHERSEFFNSAPVSLRKKQLVPSSGSLSLKSTTQPYQYVNTSKYASSFIEESKYFDLDPTGSQQFIQSYQIQIPSYFGFNTIRSEEFNFTPDMVGGKINIKIPSGSISEYSASILRIIDKNTIQVDASFADSSTNNSFRSLTDFTASYITKDVNLTSFETESFVQINFNYLEPVAGTLDKIRVSYKPYGTFGEFINVGEFPVREQNYLIDSSSLLPDKISIIEKSIGCLTGQDYETYWDLIPNPQLDLYTKFNDTISFEQGAQIYYTSSVGITSSIVDYMTSIKLKDEYLIRSCIGTEYKLQFSSRHTKQDYTNLLNDINTYQIDIYISGSPVITDDVHNSKLRNLLPSKKFGTYIGSISTDKGLTQLDSKLYFKTIEESHITPVFVIRNGSGWEIKDITLTPRNELGYSPNQAKLMVPINSLKTDVELVLKLEYLSKTGKQADVDTTLYGLNFKGSGFPKDRLLSGSGIISSSGQFKHFFDIFSSASGGGSGEDNTFIIHVQDTPATTWSFNHGLRYKWPVITIWNYNDEVVIPEKVHGYDGLTSYIYFPEPVAGYASATVGSIIPKQNYEIHTQLTPSTTWSFSHNLRNQRPVITVWNENNEVIIPEKIYGYDNLTSYIYFPEPVAGYAAATVGSVLPTGSVDWPEVVNKPTLISSSDQIRIKSPDAGVPILNVYTPGYVLNQVLTASVGDYIKWGLTDSYITSSTDQFVARSFIQLSDPGHYEVQGRVALNNLSSIVEFFFIQKDQDGTEYSSSLYSGSANSSKYIQLDYYCYITASNTKLGYYWKTEDLGVRINAQTGSSHNYFKVIKLSN